ncbi:zinc ribbon domain-containing protein [Fontisphaera persica]|uniref:FmdB family zinc ribbon protein n=1 Tax=Fontisphaera persica TaxID=2974023 RepID=UPI0024BF76B9|nr:FmdB family zinc ribbon protein [Fontisphaera persica]WCJ57971.1 zinc ribbon domain-containing protein [Fontisphaera persica]
MPTYEYVCEKCQHQFEVFQSMKDEPLTVCPKDKCPQKRWGKGKVRRLLGSGAGLIFKGSGFYITDYRSESYKAAAKKEASPSSSSSTSSSASSSSSGSGSSGSSGGNSGGGSKKT